MLKMNGDTILGAKKTSLMEFKVAALTAIIILVSISMVYSLSIGQYTIHSSGAIVLETGPLTSSFSYSSELRYTYFGSESMLIQDWPTVAATIKAYGMGPVIQKALYTSGTASELKAIRNHDYIQDAIDACHAQGIKYHVSYAVMYADFPYLISQGKGDMRMIDADGNPVTYWGDPCSPILRDRVKYLVEDLVQNYEIDGISFDYVRYDAVNVPYGPYCKAEFEAYLGEAISDSDFRTGGAFAPGGARYNEFMAWRPNAITELVGLIKTWADDARQLYHPELPPLEFTATTFMDTVDNLWWIGQDAINWVRLGYIDVLLPMYYISVGGYTPPENVNIVLAWLTQTQNLLGGTEGIIPYAPLLQHCGHGAIKPTEDLTNEINAIKQNGADGWSSWCYGGPGDNSGWPDIRPYWDLVSRPTVFSLSKISVIPTADSATITWATDLPATSKVEYSTSPLFVARKVTAPSSEYPSANLDYWDIDHVPGTIIENTTPVTNHSIIITGLSPGTLYYFRVQSQDSSGIATSKVYTFQL